MSNQTISHGQLLTTKYEHLGYTGKRMVPPPTGMLWLLVGESSAGKSYLLQTCPHALIINVDLSSTVVNTDEQVRARIWPGIDHEGFAIMQDDDGRDVRFQMTFDHILQLKDMLLNWPKDDPNRPKMLVFDTLTRLLPLVKDDVARFACTRYHIANSDDKDWKELHGPAAWDAVYDAIGNLALELRAAGYGVCMTLHLTRKYLQLSDGTYKEEVDVTVTKNFWSRLFPMFEMVAAVEHKLVFRKVEEEVKNTRTGKTEKKTQRKNIRSRVLVVDPGDDLELKGIVKQRIKMPGELMLPEENPWDTFEEAYMENARI